MWSRSSRKNSLGGYWPATAPACHGKKRCTVSQCKARRGRPVPHSNKSSLGRKYICLGCSDRPLFSPRPGSGSSRPGPAPPRHGSSRTRLVPDLHTSLKFILPPGSGPGPAQNHRSTKENGRYRSRRYARRCHRRQCGHGRRAGAAPLAIRLRPEPLPSPVRPRSQSRSRSRTVSAAHAPGWMRAVRL